MVISKAEVTGGNQINEPTGFPPARE